MRIGTGSLPTLKVGHLWVVVSSFSSVESYSDARHIILSLSTAQQIYRVPSGSPAGQKTADRLFQGRPETIESIFYMYRLTADPEWQERGWAMYTAWVEHTVTGFGFHAISNVGSRRTKPKDSMESYVLAET